MGKGTVVMEGKTKIGFAVEGEPGMLIIENKDAITKNDDPSQTRIMDSKAVHATTTTCASFELLRAAGIPTAFMRQLTPTKFVAKKCRMIALEAVARRYAVGGYTDRHPNLKKDGVPHRFHRLVFELFLKTTGGKMVDKYGSHFGETPVDVGSGRPIDDPFICNPESANWVLEHPKVPHWDRASNLNLSVPRDRILPEGVTVKAIEELVRKAFLVLEAAWTQLGCRLIDIKFEFGIDAEGNLVLADVVDNDSWRLRDRNWQELSKQLFRDCASMEDIADKYALVANLVQRLTIPHQAIVLWRGSDNDEAFPTVPHLAGITTVEETESGHKAPELCLPLLEDLLAAYPDGGVIITLIGMSNGLGPMLAARTSWPVIAVSMTAKERPHDVWSSLETPSQVPLLTALSVKNAILAALNMLAQKNPVAYMHRQYAIEQLVEPHR